MIGSFSASLPHKSCDLLTYVLKGRSLQPANLPAITTLPTVHVKASPARTQLSVPMWTFVVVLRGFLCPRQFELEANECLSGRLCTVGHLCKFSMSWWGHCKHTRWKLVFKGKEKLSKAIKHEMDGLAMLLNSFHILENDLKNRIYIYSFVL